MKKQDGEEIWEDWMMLGEEVVGLDRLNLDSICIMAWFGIGTRRGLRYGI